MENLVKNLIKESLNKRIKGHGNIDSMFDNEELIEGWLDDIMLLAENKELELDLNALITAAYGVFLEGGYEGSLEDCRAELFLSYNRFSEEISAYQKYIELRDSATEDVIIFKVKEELEFVEEGDFFFC